MKYIIGITGGSGAGKSSVSNILRENGIEITDGDKVARLIMEPGEKCLLETVSVFGKEILDDNGRLIRKKLANIVFSHKEKLLLLNKITHKYITEYFKKIITKSEDCFLGIDGAALFESGINNMCDIVIGVISDEDIRIKRIMNRDMISYDEAKRRIDLQKKDEFYIENCDVLVYNNGNIEELREQVEEVLKRLRHEKEEKEITSL